MTKSEMIAQLREAKKDVIASLNTVAKMARDMRDPDAGVSTLATLMIALLAKKEDEHE